MLHRSVHVGPCRSFSSTEVHACPEFPRSLRGDCTRSRNSQLSACPKGNVTLVRGVSMGARNRMLTRRNSNHINLTSGFCEGSKYTSYPSSLSISSTVSTNTMEEQPKELAVSLTAPEVEKDTQSAPHDERRSANAQTYYDIFQCN
jgi:hypothetical protein